METIWQNSRKPEFRPIWRPKMTQKFGPTGPIFPKPPKVPPKSLKIKFNWNPVESCDKSCWKHRFCPNLAKFGAKNGPKIWPTGAIFLTHLSVPTIYLQTKFQHPVLITFWKNGEKPPEIPFFTYFFIIRNPLQNKTFRERQHPSAPRSVNE